METYKRAFGITWNDDDIRSEVSSLSSPVSTTRKLTGLDHMAISSDCKGSDETKWMQRIRHRYEAQNDALSKWWKVALQSNIQQRMWMQRSKGEAEITLPPRFERIYQPETLGLFDRYFSRDWSRPVRRSHAAQHTDAAEEGDVSDLPRYFSESPSLSDEKKEHKDIGSPVVPLNGFLDKYGYDPWCETSLRRFSEYHARNTDTAYAVGINEEARREEYERYLAPPKDASGPPSPYCHEKVQEFSEFLADYTLSSDDVDGILRVSADSCIPSLHYELILTIGLL